MTSGLAPAPGKAGNKAMWAEHLGRGELSGTGPWTQAALGAPELPPGHPKCQIMVGR